jgi:SIR2-like domain
VVDRYIDFEWNGLLDLIGRHKCTPFIGAGAGGFQNEEGKPWLPLGNRISTEMAKEYGYPLKDIDELDSLAIRGGDDVFPKLVFSGKLRSAQIPDFSLEQLQNTPYAVLADLNLPIYITTNYDQLMEAALISKGKDPISDFCRWNEDLAEYAKENEINSIMYKENTDFKPTPANPLVYHLHGDIDHPNSMVLTERDYIDFVINLFKEEILPYQIYTALNSTALLFVGYSLKDIYFRFVFRGLMQLLEEGLGSKLQLPRIAVLLPSDFTQEKKEQALSFLEKYTIYMFKAHVYLGDVNKFVAELRQRWDDFKVSEGMKSKMGISSGT